LKFEKPSTITSTTTANLNNIDRINSTTTTSPPITNQPPWEAWTAKRRKNNRKMEINELFADNAVSMFPFSDSDNEDVNVDDQFSDLDFIRETIKKENLFPTVSFTNYPPAPSSIPHNAASISAADCYQQYPMNQAGSYPASAAGAFNLIAAPCNDYVVSAVDPLGIDYYGVIGSAGSSPLRSPTLDFLSEVGIFSPEYQPGQLSQRPSTSPTKIKSASAAPVTNPRRGGRKKGSSIQCDENLIMRLLPMTTKSFNQEIKNLDLSQEEVRKLKFARRRIKNARAAQNRRSKLITSLHALQKRVDFLVRENHDLQRKLTEALSENTILRNVCNPAPTSTSTSSPNNINNFNEQRVAFDSPAAPVCAPEVDHVPQLP